MSRISTAQMAQRSIDTITARQAEMSKLQQQISSGNRLSTPGDDPAAADQTVRQHAEISRLGIEKRMVDFARLRLQQSEAAIGEGVDILQRARELLVAANNDSYSPADRRFMATELRGLRTELLNVANRSDGLGGHVFGGIGSRTPPYVEGADGVQYRADPGSQLTGQERTFAISIDGSRIFDAAAEVDGDRSVFAALDRTVAILENPPADGADVHAGIEAMIDDIDSSLGGFNSLRAGLGEQLNAVDRRDEQIATGTLTATERLADLNDVDFAEAISALTARRTELDAAMQTYAQISGLSLFNYIR